MSLRFAAASAFLVAAHVAVGNACMFPTVSSTRHDHGGHAMHHAASSADCPHGLCFAHGFAQGQSESTRRTDEGIDIIVPPVALSFPITETNAVAPLGRPARPPGPWSVVMLC